jgi:hypothetical protein
MKNRVQQQVWGRKGANVYEKPDPAAGVGQKMGKRV